MECGIEGPIVITRNGKAAAVLLVPYDDDDLERLLLGRSPRFQALFNRSRRSIEAGEGLSEKDFWKAVRQRGQEREGKTRRPANREVDGSGLAIQPVRESTTTVAGFPENFGNRRHPRRYYPCRKGRVQSAGGAIHGEAIRRAGPAAGPDAVQPGRHRRADRRAAPGAVRDRPGRGGRAGLRGPGRAARADGPARLPGRPARPARRAGRVPGHVPRPGPARPARSGCGTRWAPGCIGSPAGSRVRARSTAARRREHERRAAEARPDDGPGRGLDDEPDGRCSTRRSTGCRSATACRWCSATSRACTHEQAARHLGWPVGTVKSRLTERPGTLAGPARPPRRRPGGRLGEDQMATTGAVGLRGGAGRPGGGHGPGRVPDRGRCGRNDGRGGPGHGRPVDGRSTEHHVRDTDQVRPAGLRTDRRRGRRGRAAGGPRPPRASDPRPANAGATGSVAASPADSEDDGTVVAREMAGVELGLWRTRCSQLREQVNDRAPVEESHYETRSSRGESIGREVIEHARQAHMLAREAYLEKARELASRRRRVVKLEEPREADREASADVAPGGDRDRRSESAHEAARHRRGGRLDRHGRGLQAVREGRRGPQATHRRSR